MTKSAFRGSVAALLLAMVSATGAEAQLTLTAPDCGDWLSGGYTQCAGAFEGNDSNQDVAGWLLANWGFNVTSTAKSDGGDAPFLNNPGGTAGTLNLSGVSGVFVLSLKAADQFSLYKFDTHGATWTSLDLNTIGTSVNKKGIPQGLSHASLYLGSTSTVPEPISVVLLGTGLAGLGALSWRRRKKETEQL